MAEARREVYCFIYLFILFMCYLYKIKLQGFLLANWLSKFGISLYDVISAYIVNKGTNYFEFCAHVS